MLQHIHLTMTVKAKTANQCCSSHLFVTIYTQYLRLAGQTCWEAVNATAGVRNTSTSEQLCLQKYNCHTLLDCVMLEMQ